MPEPTGTGRIIAVNGNLLSASFDTPVALNEVAFACLGDLKLKAEVVRVRNEVVDLQVFEDTAGLALGDTVEFTGEQLTAVLGPGLLGQVFDGLQNPLPALALQSGAFLERGVTVPALDAARRWPFTPEVEAGARVRAGDSLGTVLEGPLTHRIMVPFGLQGRLTVVGVRGPGEGAAGEPVATLRDERGREIEVTMLQRWPVKRPVRAYRRRLAPGDPLVTKVRSIDTLFPVALGGTFCIPGPFGAGKTVLQQITSRHAEVDVVVVAACGERAGEVVETLREFPELVDPRSGHSLMERTIIICNTSSMPVAAREASVYTATTLAEYYRQMGLNTLLLADSTSRWAQALREVSGRLEEIPGEEAFPAYLESVVASFYERAGAVELHDGRRGSLTIGGTVSPAGGNFEEPVTQATLKVVGAFHGLSRERSDARRYPAIDPLESWSHYSGVADEGDLAVARRTLHDGHEIDQMMKVVGEEGTSLGDVVTYLKAEYLDAAYLQQDAFHEVDGATGAERQHHVFRRIAEVLRTPMELADKASARRFFQELTQRTKEWNLVPMDDPEFAALESEIEDRVREVSTDA